MKEIYIIILIFLLLIIFLRNKYYDLYVNEPYITVYARSGLSNKLRVILSYLYRANKEGKKLKVIWTIDDECPEVYNKLFEPIDNLEVISTKTEYDYYTWDEDNHDYRYNNYYKLLKPLPNIQNIINIYKNELLNNYIACHIRRTDSLTHVVHIQKSDIEYMEFIDSLDPTMKIYIATDNKDTQDVFFNKYNDRIIMKQIIPSDNLRQTSVQDAVVDIYICAGAKYFMGSQGSSFTNIINYLKE
jgi:hypothetical protein